MRQPKRHATSRLRLVVDNKSSSVRATPAARAAARSRKCQAPGIAPRTFHLAVCQSDAPAERATSAIKRQRSREKMSMPGVVGHTVLKIKRPPSLDPRWKTDDVADVGRKSRQPVEIQLIERTRGARIRAEMTQLDMAKGLQIPQDTYKNYELDRPLPLRLIPAFCRLARINETQLFNDSELLRISLNTPRVDRSPRPETPQRRTRSRA